ncbi:MAG: hypothetical protein ACXVXC_11790 [Nocardioidaceae bacterium]
MRLTRLLTHLLVPALVGVPAAALGAGAASAETAWSTQVTIQLSRATQQYASTFKVLGQLVATDPTDDTNQGGVGGQTIHLMRMQSTESDYKEITTQVTDSSGVVEFDVPAKSNASFELVYDGGTYDLGTTPIDLAAATSAARTSHVYRNLNAHGLKRNGHLFYLGNVDPGYGHKTIYLQRKTCESCKWKAYGKQQTGANGSWSFRVGAPRTGRWDFRTWVPGDKSFVKGYGAGIYTYVN